MGQKRKIINDPVYGFITVRHPFILDLIDHPWFQRLRRIAQLGLSHLVYPGAIHNRFQHAIGAMHLMQNAIDEIRLRGHQITLDEELGLLAAILLHDIGHGPFSHALEKTIVQDLHHESLSLWMMQHLNGQFHGKLDTAIAIFTDQYPKKYMHQLVSSQLDMDRLDYLARDSFFSGVVEGQVGSERIIKMLDVVDDELVIEEKGIYSIEKFIVARRFMYWQVYLHKTVLSAEFMLLGALRRARKLASEGEVLFCSPSLEFFLYGQSKSDEFRENTQLIERFATLGDDDITVSLKAWQYDKDPVLSSFSKRLVGRQLFRIEMQKTPFAQEEIQMRIDQIADSLHLSQGLAEAFLIQSDVDNLAYDARAKAIRMKMKSGKVIDATEISDHLNLTALSEEVRKYFICYPKEAGGPAFEPRA